jgi:hypothetical protein
MSREARTLLVLGLMSLVAVVVLGGMAHRYQKALERRDDTPATVTHRGGPWAARSPQRVQDPRAVDELDAFLRVRRALRNAIDRGATGEAVLREIRAEALVQIGLSGNDYLRVRELYRRWKSGGAGAANAQLRGLEQRRAELEAVDLGRYEALDL